jgi:type I restriction enzyme, R subunit
VVERIVAGIDGIIRLVRFPGWQRTKAGEREVQKALRKVVYVKYKIKGQDLFGNAKAVKRFARNRSRITC